MQRGWIWGLFLFFGGNAAAASAGTPLEAHGAADGLIPAWTITSIAPSGWTKDCCTYASAIGVNYVLYQGVWTGKPERVMVLNVWPSKLATLDAELQDDRAHYLQRDPGAKISAFEVNNRAMPCRGSLYAGTDHIDDVVVFCDPGKPAGIRLSWSMTLTDIDAMRKPLLDSFRAVVEHSRYTSTLARNSGAGTR